MAVVGGRGEEGVSWNVMENAAKRPVHTRDVGTFVPRKSKSKMVSRGGSRRKASRNTGSVAAGIVSQRVLETSKFYNNSDCTHRMMKQGFFAMKSGEWEEYKNILSERR